MARPAGWEPLAGSDPIPGDPAGISAEAAHLSSVAEQIARQVAVLRRIAAGQSDEKGLHAEKLRSAASDTAAQLDKVAGRYQQAGAALSAWVPELEYAQAQSLKALAQAQDAGAQIRRKDGRSCPRSADRREGRAGFREDPPDPGGVDAQLAPGARYR